MRKWIALGVSLISVVVLHLLATHGLLTPIPFWLLSPGIMAGALCPDSGFNPEGDLHPWGPVSSSVTYAVDVALYWCIAYAVLTWLRIPPRPSAASPDLPQNPAG